ncbi:MAG TPA: T9SS type A sorting domain-containing protein [Rhodothermales bacterium]|nr:T9SS type A sorting domain-containing protein [Rhodothermales bacterium]
MRKLFFVLVALFFCTMAWAQPARTTNTLYDITFKGKAITLDGDLSDWSDAQWIFLSQDKVNFLDPTNRPIQGRPKSPADFSGFFAIKMDAENIYFAVKVKDEGTPMIETPSTPNLAFVYDHLSVYLGLYDIGALGGSPHTEGAGQVYFIDPVKKDTIKSSIRTYRIGPGTDNLKSTLGPDFQLLLRALPYAPGTKGTAVSTYSGAMVDTTIVNTEAGSKLTTDEQGYTLEWKVPFASLAGKISKGTREYKNFIWPLFTPKDGMVIVFDADITDLDEGESNSGGTTRFMRIGNMPALWRDSKSFQMRGRIVDMSDPKNVNNSPASRYPIDYKPAQTIVLDGKLDDWKDAKFFGFSQEALNFAGAVVPKSPADLSGYVGLKMDDNNLYVAASVRDEGNGLAGTTADAAAAKFFDSIRLYLGLYNIKNRAGSPHTETTFNFNKPGGGTVAANSAYRIGTGTDNTFSTLGADQNLILRSLPYAAGAKGTAYIAGLVNQANTTWDAASVLGTDNKTYTIEWTIPFASLGGALGAGDFAGFNWPTFKPAVGMFLPLDMELTDLEDGEATNGSQTRVLRAGSATGPDKNPVNWGLRGIVTQEGLSIGVKNESTEIPAEFVLASNYPNPFNPTTTIEFGLPMASDVRLSVFNLLGQEVAVLASGTQTAGTHTVTFEAGNLPSGTYLYRLSTPQYAVTKRMVLVK